MVGNADSTRRRILDAATDEFARHGIAGARIDRISDAAASNKAMIYRYFGNKAALFDAVFFDVVVRTISDVPIDADDLPGYAVRLWDWHRSDSNPIRVGAWDELERDSEGARSDTVRKAMNDKLDLIKAAQKRGTVTDSLSADEVLRSVIALSRIGVADVLTARAAKAQRAAIRCAVERVTAPK